jgi:hypothetical protein
MQKQLHEGHKDNRMAQVIILHVMGDETDQCLQGLH